MNTVVTSREEILRAAGEMVKVGKGDGVSMRGIARECGIAVGSIYNYFPTKNDLMIAVVVEMWKEIFFVPLSKIEGKSFLVVVECILERMGENRGEGQGFLAGHAFVVGDKEKGHLVMEEYLGHMREELLAVLMGDSAVVDEVWSDGFSAEDFVRFVVDFLVEDLMRGTDRAVFLRELILRVVYGRKREDLR